MASGFIKRLRNHHGLVALVLSVFIRLLGRTVRFTCVDECGITRRETEGPTIWLFWHNRILLMAPIGNKFTPGRDIAVLTSPSKDGEMIARVVKHFGIGAVRGSSNKRSAAALREMVSAVRQGEDLGITPDGPRGPRYRLQAGALKLAQLSRVPIMPVHLRYERAWALKSWDGFLIPKPFTKARLTFGTQVPVNRDADAEELERIRQTLETSMTAEAERPWKD